jgi:N-acetylmuramic acid 6-phosphate etherase
MVQGIIAGGAEALWRSVEGAEDDAEAGARSIGGRRLGTKDIVVGIAASGRTPFVLGALAEARRRGARTVLLCFNPKLVLARSDRPHLLIALGLGPEVLTGSTRLKCGTATKMVLNMLTTLSMVRLGKVVSNLMVDLNPSNAKLRDRATRIVSELAGCATEDAAKALARAGWHVKSALADFGTSGGKPGRTAAGRSAGKHVARAR